MSSSCIEEMPHNAHVHGNQCMNKQVMVFDEFDIHPAAESEVGIVDWDRTYPMTKYYYL